LLQKILLHGDLLDLGVKLLDQRFITLLGLLGFASKSVSNLLFGLLFPLGYLVRVDAIFTGLFGKGGGSPGRASKATRGLNSAENLLLFLDIKSLLWASYVHLKLWSSFLGSVDKSP